MKAYRGGAGLEEGTYYRAKTIIRRKEILPLPDCTRYCYHFAVRQRSGVWTDVWVNLVNGSFFYFCNSVSKTKKVPWGCVMRINDHSKPYCSHTLSAKYYLRERGIIEKN